MNGLALAAAIMVVTGLTHSIVGEKRLITPALAIDAALMQRPLARRVLRFAWHFTTVLMLLCAALVVWPGVPRGLLLLAGATWTGVGLFDAVLTRGEHIGWPLLTLAGVLTLIGAW